MMIHSLHANDHFTFMNNAINSSQGSYRRLFHSSPLDNMQVMVIAFKPDLFYPFIRDDLSGLITFTCLYGSLFIQTKATYNSNPDTLNLSPGSIVSFPRSFWRSTKSGANGAIFVECIEGQFLPAHRKTLQPK